MNNQKIQNLIKNNSTRKELCAKSHYYFFHVYLSDYIKYPTADLHKQMLEKSQDPKIKVLAVAAFRGCGKSSVLTTSLPIWAVIGEAQKKFITIFTQTQEQAKQTLKNIRQELEDNKLLINDFGAFCKQDQWNENNLYIPKYKAKIMALSRDQSIRGLRSGAVRPDLIICDDLEDLESAKTDEGRKKVYEKYKSEIYPMGSDDVKCILIGNIVHEDCLLNKIIKEMEHYKNKNVSLKYPIIKNNKPTWPGKFPNLKAIEKLEKEINDYHIWQREYMLTITAKDDQIIKPEWIHYYDELPDERTNPCREIITGVDLAISEKQTADYTAMVPVKVYGRNKKLEIYILPNILNKKISFSKIIKTLQELSISLGNGQPTHLYIEEVAMQQIFVQEMEARNIPVLGIRPQGDKSYRLNTISHLIENGTVKFPRDESAKLLINQLLGFKYEKHDDLCDALTLIVPTIVANSKSIEGEISTGGKSIFAMDSNEFEIVEKEDSLRYSLMD